VRRLQAAFPKRNAANEKQFLYRIKISGVWDNHNMFGEIQSSNHSTVCEINEIASNDVYNVTMPRTLSFNNVASLQTGVSCTYKAALKRDIHKLLKI
jgi:hypothetical protein